MNKRSTGFNPVKRYSGHFCFQQFHIIVYLTVSKSSLYAAIKMSLSFMVSVQVFIGVPAVLVLIAAFLVVMPVVDNPQVRKEHTPNRWTLMTTML